MLHDITLCPYASALDADRYYVLAEGGPTLTARAEQLKGLGFHQGDANVFISTFA